MDNQLILKIITPERIVCERKVVKVVAVATDGEFCILPNHEPLLNSLKIDVVKFESTNHEVELACVIGGILEVENNYVTILTDIAELETEIDVVRAKQAKERLMAISTESKVEDSNTAQMQFALLKAIIRIKVHELSRQKKSASGRFS